MQDTKQLTINIHNIENKKVIGFELNDISKDEAIVIFNRCIFQLLNGYDDYIEIKP